MGTIISLINLKGGVGKTTCCVNIAGEFANSHKKVLVIDMDTQANASVLLMNPVNYNRKILLENENNNSENNIISKTIYQVFRDEIYDENKFSFDNTIIKSVIKINGNKRMAQEPLPNLDLIPTTYHLQTLEQNIVNYDRTKYIILNKVLKKIKDKYDLIFIDCPPNIYTATKNALYASDFYIIPTLPDYLSMSGIHLLINQLNKIIEIKEEETEKSVKLLGILLNNVDGRTNVHKEGIKNIGHRLDLFKQQKMVNENAVIFNTRISKTVKINEASGEFLPICLNSPRDKATGEFKSLCTEILDQIAVNKE